MAQVPDPFGVRKNAEESHRIGTRAMWPVGRAGKGCVGRRAPLGMDVGPSEAEPSWTAFLRGLDRWGLCGVSS